ncbi:MAG: metE [Rhodocyclales bacterium]|nr:metE [Rhodocyclales bacterium]
MTRAHASTHILGYPRIGAKRELKQALESFWSGQSDESALKATGRALRARHWQTQQAAGLDFVTVGDFAWYDQVLQTLALFNALPTRFGFDAQTLDLGQLFTCARGNADHFAMEMTKWFDTNYHYLVPEYTPDTRFGGGARWLLEELAEARAAGYSTKVALIGPLSLLYLGKEKRGLADRLRLLPDLLNAYGILLAELHETGVTWVQIDEPILALDLPAVWLAAFLPSYSQLAVQAPPLLLTTYFGSVAQHAELLRSLPVAGLHLDLVRAPEQLAAFINGYPSDRVLSLGLIDGRNIWRSDLDRTLVTVQQAYAQLGERLWLSASCSLLHVPVDLAHEEKLDAELKSWLAFARQKLDEIVLLSRALGERSHVVEAALTASRAALSSRRQSTRVTNAQVQKRLDKVTAGDAERISPFSQRQLAQREALNLPLLPTTTIGSFPQTPDIRALRAAYKRGELGNLAYLEGMRAQIRLAVDKQNEYGLDVLVHGEAERNDMVEYFGEQLWGYAFSENGWVQSYGSRCVKPPILYGDVLRPEAMTVGWTRYAQSLTDKPMKGMLSGPITMLQWSFVRDDQPRATTALQIALALRDEVRDLENAGIRVIQIDEPALREGLPLCREDWAVYLDWAVRAFRITAGGVSDATQIHTHMCYAEFNDILPAIAAMDADVITIETSRSDMELLEGFGEFSYPNEIGPGVYDIHSPRTPTADEMERLLRRALKVIPVKRLWVNPDCGLKTRIWSQVDPALTAMVAAAKRLREEFAVQAS